MWFTNSIRNEQKMLGVLVGDPDVDKTYGKFTDFEYLNLPYIVKSIIKSMSGYEDVNISKCGPPWGSQGPGKFYTTEPYTTLFTTDLKTTCEDIYKTFFDRN